MILRYAELSALVVLLIYEVWREEEALRLAEVGWWEGVVGDDGREVSYSEV